MKARDVAIKVLPAGAGFDAAAHGPAFRRREARLLGLCCFDHPQTSGAILWTLKDEQAGTPGFFSALVARVDPKEVTNGLAIASRPAPIPLEEAIAQID